MHQLPSSQELFSGHYRLNKAAVRCREMINETTSETISGDLLLKRFPVIIIKNYQIYIERNNRYTGL